MLGRTLIWYLRGQWPLYKEIYRKFKLSVKYPVMIYFTMIILVAFIGNFNEHWR